MGDASSHGVSLGAAETTKRQARFPRRGGETQMEEVDLGRIKAEKVAISRNTKGFVGF